MARFIDPRVDKQEIEQKELGMGNFQGYPSLLRQIKHRVSFAQQKAMYAANEELLRMNWDIGEMLTKSQEADGWGKKTLQRLAVDLKNEYPERKGFSVRNMQCMMQFYNEYNKELTMAKVGHFSIAQPLVAQLKNNVNTLPIKHLNWTHNLILLQRVKDLKARYWYMVQCITGHWSKDYLAEAIKLDYYGKHGALANNFDTTLPATEALEVKSLLKDPYIFDMLTFTDQYDERDIEIGLIKHIEKFLVEMGAGFAFMGRQYHIEVSGDDYYIDMLMYNTFMHRYLVIELKATDFMPEYIGKLNFYCSAERFSQQPSFHRRNRKGTQRMESRIIFNRRLSIPGAAYFFSFSSPFSSIFSLKPWKLRGKVVSLQKKKLHSAN